MEIQATSADVICCRPFLPVDRPYLLNIARQTWNGNDYVPYILDDWIADSSGIIFSAVYHGNAVGMIRLSRLSDTQWWLEGLRVDPAIRGRKIGQQLFLHALKYYRTQCRGVIRMLTGEKNLVSQHIAEKNHFILRTSLDLYEAAPDADHANHLVLASSEHAEDIFAWLNQLNDHPLLIPYLDYGWVLNAPEKPMIQKLIEEKKVWINVENNAVLILQQEFLQGQLDSFIQAVQPGRLGLTEILTSARRIAADRYWQKITWMAPSHEDIHAALDAAAFLRDPDERVRFYELVEE